MAKRRDEITVREGDQYRTYPLEKPAPRLVRDQVHVTVLDGGEQSFSLDDLIGWVFRGQVHVPDSRGDNGGR